MCLARTSHSFARTVHSLAVAMPSLARTMLKPSDFQPRGTRRSRQLVLTDGWDGWMVDWSVNFFFAHIMETT